jgi:hypothetical protein
VVASSGVVLAAAVDILAEAILPTTVWDSLPRVEIDFVLPLALCSRLDRGCRGLEEFAFVEAR